MTAWVGPEVELPGMVGVGTVFLGPPRREPADLLRVVLARPERHLWVNEGHWRAAGWALPLACLGAGWTVTASCALDRLADLAVMPVGIRVAAHVAATALPRFLRIDLSPYTNATVDLSNAVYATPRDYLGDTMI